MNQINTTTGGIPRFLTKTFEADDKAYTEEACAHYLRATNTPPSQFAKMAFTIKWLHPYITHVDRRWQDIPVSEMKTTKPRNLVHSMNTYINRWKKDVKKVQEAIDCLPEQRDQTAELDEGGDQSKTESDHSQQDQEEVKNEVDFKKLALFTRTDESLSNAEKDVNKIPLTPEAKANPIEDHQSQVITDPQLQNDERRPPQTSEKKNSRPQKEMKQEQNISTNII